MTDLHITKTNGVDGVVAGPADDLHHHRHQPARAERRDWRHGHRHVPGDADRRDVDLCRRTGGGTCVRRVGSGNINTSVTVPVGASVVFTATGTVNPAATGELVNSAQVVPPAGLANRTSAIATDHDAIDTEADVAHHQDGAGVRSSPAIRSSTRSPSPTPGRRTPRAWS